MSEPDPIVFVVDDDESVREALKRLLRSVGLAAETFASAHDFLQHERPDRPACLVLDIRMPRMSGLDLQRELASAETTPPIIFITGHGDIPMAVQAMKDGAVEFLQKPFNDQELIDAIHRAIECDIQARSKSAEIGDIQQRANALTPREGEVMAYVVSGMLNKQIAYDLGTSEKTIKVHRARVMEKMKADSLAELVRLAGKLGIHGPGDQSS